MITTAEHKSAKNVVNASQSVFCEILGNPIMPVSACRTRYKQALENREMGLRHLHECIDCPKGPGTSNQTKMEEEMSKKGTCECCGRNDMNLPQKVFDRAVCGFCKSALLSAKESNLGFDDVHEIIKEMAAKLKPGKQCPTDWPWLDVSSQADGVASPGNEPFSEQSAEVSKPPVADVSDLSGQNENDDSADLETLDRINAMLNRKEETGNPGDVLMRKHLMTVNEVWKKERNVIYIDLNDEPELCAWLHAQGRKNRRSNPTDQVLAILDASMAGDRVQG